MRTRPTSDESGIKRFQLGKNDHPDPIASTLVSQLACHLVDTYSTLPLSSADRIAAVAVAEHELELALAEIVCKMEGLPNAPARVEDDSSSAVNDEVECEEPVEAPRLSGELNEARQKMMAKIEAEREALARFELSPSASPDPEADESQSDDDQPKWMKPSKAETKASSSLSKWRKDK